MSLIPVNLATEDELSEVILYKILSEIDRYVVGTAYRRGGFGYLRKTIHGWNSAAKGIPFIVLADLDTTECPAKLIKDWLPTEKHPNLLFRIAVCEVESWVLADPKNLSDFLKLKVPMAPTNTDEISDPKAFIVDLAGKSRSKVIRESIVPRVGSTARQVPITTAA